MRSIPKSMFSGVHKTTVNISGFEGGQKPLSGSGLAKRNRLFYNYPISSGKKAF